LVLTGWPAVTAYWILVAAAGWGLTSLIPLRWLPLERLPAAALTGLVGSTLLGFILALALGPGAAAALLPPALITAVTFVRFRPRRLRPWPAELPPRLRTAGFRWSLAIVAVTGLGSWFLFAHALQVGPHGTLVAASNLWGDWSVHTSYVQSFHLGRNLPPRDSVEAGTAFRYPFLVDFQPALLEALGQNLAGALDMPSFVVGWAAMVLVFQLATRVTRRPAAGALALGLILFGGGLGFVGAYGDGCQQLAVSQPGFDSAACTHLSTATPLAVVAFVGHLPTELTHLPRFYDGQQQVDPPLPDLQWYEPLLVYWLPQRDFAFGMGLVALGLSCLWEAVRRRRTVLAIAAGILTATVPLFNPFGYLFLGLSGLWWSWRRGWWRGMAAAILPAALLGLPQLYFEVAGPHGSATGPLGPNLFPALDIGWLSHATSACTATQLRAGDACSALYLAGASPADLGRYLLQTLSQPSFYGAFLGFWLSNTGIFLVLAVGLVALAAARARTSARSRRLQLLRFWAPGWVAFLLANLVITQPWNWDNTKLLSYWYLVVAIPLAWLLTQVPRGAWLRGLATVATVTLVASGILAELAGLEGRSNVLQTAPSGATASLAGPAELTVAREVERRTSPRAIFLTEGQPNDPVTSLAGRTALLGYYGWLWSYGQPLAARYRAVQLMYAGCPASGPCQVGHLLARYRVGYVEFEPGDYNQISTNLAWYRGQHLPVVASAPGYLIFDVRSLWR
jgi:hypothetical protein